LTFAQEITPSPDNVCPSGAGRQRMHGNT
jgi:hypothetical protein